MRRGAYLCDFIFDAVVEDANQQGVMAVLSFAAERKDWTPAEREAGHFLYAVHELDARGSAVIQPPKNGNGAATSYDRVRRWLDHEDVPAFTPDEIEGVEVPLGHHVAEVAVPSGS